MLRLQFIQHITPILARLRCHWFVFVLLATFVNSALFHFPLFKFAANNLNLQQAGGWLTLTTLFAIQYFLTATLLATSAVISIRLAKALAMLIFVGNSIAWYFISVYGVLLDKSMLGNVFSTNVNEASSYLNIHFLLSILGLGVLPALIIAFIPITPIQRLKRILFAGAMAVLGMLWIYLNSASWLWLDRYAKQVGSLILPWSYVINSARYLNESSRTEQKLLPAAHFVDNDPIVVVLVIGESARAANFSLYGYERKTNPELSASPQVFALPRAVSCATYTTAAIECMLSPTGKMDHFEPLTSYLQQAGIDVTWRSNNFGEPPMQVAKYLNSTEIEKRCSGAHCSRLQYDDVLLYDLAQDIQNSSAQKQFIVLHQTGSHGPQYFTKYPPQFELFKPVCRSVELNSCSHDELVNAYDNTIVYNDTFLNNLIELLGKSKFKRAVMLYVSDHGESLGEYGLYLHGAPYALAPSFQKEIPFIVWMSDDFAASKNINREIILKKFPVAPQSLVFHSIMGAMGLRSDIYNSRLDLFAR